MHCASVHDFDKAAFFMHWLAPHMFTYGASVHERCSASGWKIGWWIFGALERFLGFVATYPLIGCCFGLAGALKVVETWFWMGGKVAIGLDWMV
jgi:hypothetical protein